MKHTLRKTLRIILSAMLCALTAMMISGCAGTDTGGAASSTKDASTAYNMIILTESDFEESKGKYFGVFSSINDEIIKKSISTPIVDTDYYCVFVGWGNGFTAGDYAPYGQMSLTLNGGTDDIIISECSGDLNFFNDSFGSIFTPNDEETELKVTQRQCGADFSFNNAIIGFRFTIAIKFTLKKAGRFAINGDCSWRGVTNKLPALEVYARFTRHVDIDEVYVAAARESECVDGEIPQDMNILGSALQVNQSYLITFKFGYNVAADQDDASSFNAVISGKAENLILYYASSGLYESATANGVTTVKVKYTLSENSADRKEAKITLRFTPARTGVYTLNFSLSGEETSFTETANTSFDLIVR